MINTECYVLQGKAVRDDDRYPRISLSRLAKHQPLDIQSKATNNDQQEAIWSYFIVSLQSLHFVAGWTTDWWETPWIRSSKISAGHGWVPWVSYRFSQHNPLGRMDAGIVSKELGWSLFSLSKCPKIGVCEEVFQAFVVHLDVVTDG